MVLRLRWNSDRQRRPMGGSAAWGGEGKAEVGLARGSNGGADGAHREDESTAVLLHDSGGAVCFSCWWQMRGKRGNKGCRAGGPVEEERGEGKI
jgi:hypothetical protein